MSALDVEVHVKASYSGKVYTFHASPSDTVGSLKARLEAATGGSEPASALLLAFTRSTPSAPSTAGGAAVTSSDSIPASVPAPAADVWAASAGSLSSGGRLTLLRDDCTLEEAGVVRDPYLSALRRFR